MQIEIFKKKCSECDSVWYELEGFEQDECPHCETGTDYASVLETQVSELEIDSETGRLSFAGSN